MEIHAPKVKRQYVRRDPAVLFMIRVNGIKKAIKQHSKVKAQAEKIQSKADRLKAQIKRAKARLVKGF